MKPIKVLIVDDHEVVRLGLRTLLQLEADISVVGESGTVDEALQQTDEKHPDVVIMDVQLPDRSGLEACKEIRSRFPDIKVIMLTSYISDSFVLGALQAGASGFVLKKVGNAELLRAVRSAAKGEAALDPQTTAKLIAQVNEMQKRTDQEAFRNLSARELEISLYVSLGKGNKEIAKIMHISETTVRNYVSNILQKLQLHNRTELATYAVRHRLEDYFQSGNPDDDKG